MVIKKILFLILVIIALVGCGNKYDSKSEENIKETGYEVRYEYIEGKYFTIKKVNDNKYSFYYEDNGSAYFHTKTKNGFIFSYNFYIDDNGAVKDVYCYFDERTNTVEKILDTSYSNYGYSIEGVNSVLIFCTRDNFVEIFHFSENGAKKILDSENFSFRHASSFKEGYLIWYEDKGRVYLKNIDGNDGTVTDINISEENASSYRQGIISAYRDGDNIYYCLLKRDNNDEIKCKLVKHSFSKNKEIYSMEVPKGLYPMIVKGDIFIFGEINREDGSITSPDAFIMKKVGKELKEIKPISDAQGLFFHSINKNYILVGTYDIVCKVNLRNFERDYVKVVKSTSAVPRVSVQNIIGDQIMVLTSKENESIFEFYDFKALEEKY